jgi:hypothetical protein
MRIRFLLTGSGLPDIDLSQYTQVKDSSGSRRKHPHQELKFSLD